MVALRILLKRIRQEPSGFGLIEATISLGLLGLIAACFLVAMASSYKVGALADEQVTANSLARSQMEYVEQQPYNGVLDINYQASYDKIDIATIPEGYDILSIDRDGALVEEIVGIPWDPDPSVDLALAAEDLEDEDIDKVVGLLQSMEIDIIRQDDVEEYQARLLELEMGALEQVLRGGVDAHVRRLGELRLDVDFGAGEVQTGPGHRSHPGYPG